MRVVAVFVRLILSITAKGCPHDSNETDVFETGSLASSINKVEQRRRGSGAAKRFVEHWPSGSGCKTHRSSHPQLAAWPAQVCLTNYLLGRGTAGCGTAPLDEKEKKK